MDKNVREVEVTEEVDVLFQEVCDELNIDVSKNSNSYEQNETHPTESTNYAEIKIEPVSKSDYDIVDSNDQEDR